MRIETLRGPGRRRPLDRVRLGTVGSVRCPACSTDDDRVVDSRTADDGSAIRRRRKCLVCGHRFTTFERPEEAPLVVRKRSGDDVPFDREKIVAGVEAAAKGRPVEHEQLEALADDIEESLRLSGGRTTSTEIGMAVLERLRSIDQVAYVRFASVYKSFDAATDFEREVGLLSEADDPGPDR